MTLKTDRGIFIPNTSFSTPVLFLIFNRPDTTQQVFSAIREAKPPRLYVAANSPRSENHEEKKLCDTTRKIIETVDWNCEVQTLFRETYLDCRQSLGGAINSYTYVKAIAEELRGLAVEYNLPIVTATQTTRSGFASSDVGLEDTSESFGLPATADLMFALISTEELEDLNQIMVKQLKNRYNDPTGANKKFVLGIDRAKMRLYDVEDTAQTLNVRPEPAKVINRYEEFNV